MTIEVSDAGLCALMGRLEQISVILHTSMMDVVSTSLNWRETIAEMRGDICQRVTDIACESVPDDLEVRAMVYHVVDVLFDEARDLIDEWAMRAMHPEPPDSGLRNMH